MKIKMKNIALSIAAAATMVASPALALDNTHYGETRVNQLPEKGKSAHQLWVGSWWAYTRNGINDRHKRSFAECSSVDMSTDPQTLVADGNEFCLSPIEKIDFLKARIDKVEWDKVEQYMEITQMELTPLQEQVRPLIRTLNKWINENPGEDWKETDDGKEYLRLNEELETAKGNLPEFTIDTGSEFESINHGNGVAGVGTWWGHCNAWSAASIMEDEPRVRGTVTVDGNTVDFTPGEAKALITEGWMEHRSSFYGARHDGKDNEGPEYEDVTPAGFHIYFGTQLGLRQKSFVIDRYTGDQVWNQPVRSYVWEIEEMYEDDTAETLELFQTEYDNRGNIKKNSLGEKQVYPVAVTANIHWMTDGLPHEQATVDNIMVDEYPTTSSRAHDLWHGQIEMRTLSYTLYLDRPLSDASARIVGDGKWDAGLAGSNQAQPDFMWQPLNQTASRRDYENPMVEYAMVVDKILPATAREVVAPVSDELTSSDTPLEIPDNNSTGITSTINVDLEGVLTNVVINVDITHTYQGDLKLVLKKDGASHVLHSNSGGSADDIKRGFDVPALKGKAAAGDWTLTITDNAGSDVGTLNKWSLDLETAAGEPVVDPPVEEGNTETFEDDDLPVAIPDNDEDGVQTSVYISRTGTVQKLEVSVDIAHTYIGDLTVQLVKTGKTYTLHANEGGSEDNLVKTFTVDAAVGTSIRGKWKLIVRDGAADDVGKIQAYSIKATWN